MIQGFHVVQWCRRVITNDTLDQRYTYGEKKIVALIWSDGLKF